MRYPRPAARPAAATFKAPRFFTAALLLACAAVLEVEAGVLVPEELLVAPEVAEAATERVVEAVVPVPVAVADPELVLKLTGCEIGSTEAEELCAAAEPVELAAAVTLEEPPLHFPMLWMLS